MSSLQRRKRLSLPESALAALCSLRAFFAQASAPARFFPTGAPRRANLPDARRGRHPRRSHSVQDAATQAHTSQTRIADACEGERAPWDYRMRGPASVAASSDLGRVEDSLAHTRQNTTGSSSRRC